MSGMTLKQYARWPALDDEYGVAWWDAMDLIGMKRAA